MTEDQKTIAMMSLMWMVERRKEEQRESQSEKEAEGEGTVKQTCERDQREHGGKIETTLEKLANKKREDRRRLEREGDEIMELSRKYERKEEEERQNKQNAEMWAKWEDRQRLERQGAEIMEMVRRHEQEEEEKRRQAEGMTAGDEYRMMLGMAERHAQEMSEHRKMVEEETRERRREARERTVEGTEEKMEKAQGTLMLKSGGSSSDSMLMRLREEKEELKRTAMRLREEKEQLGRLAEGRVLSRHLAEAKRDEEAKKMRGTGKSKNQVKEGKEDQQTREDEHELLGHLIART